MTDKESCTVILNNIDYIDKISKIIDEGIANGKYIETSDITHADLKQFQDFFYSNFKDKTCHEDMHPVSNEPARFFATAKAYKLNTKEEINVEHLKLRVIIDQMDTDIYNA